MKYFIAIPISQQLQAKIDTFQRKFPTNDVPNVVEPHITVKRPAENVDINFWIENLKNICKEIKTFKINLEGIGNFGDDVVFITPQISNELTNLHKKIYEGLEGTTVSKGFEYDDYHPHITLGGTSWGMTSDELIEMKKEAEKELVNLENFEVNFIRIYKKPEGQKSWEILEDVHLNKDY